MQTTWNTRQAGQQWEDTSETVTTFIQNYSQSQTDMQISQNFHSVQLINVWSVACKQWVVTNGKLLTKQQQAQLHYMWLSAILKSAKRTTTILTSEHLRQIMATINTAYTLHSMS